MPKVIPIGPPNNHLGKTLWEILGNLKNFGVGRYVKRNVHEKYAEPSYFRILKVETLPAPLDEYDLPRKVRAYTERVFRGRKFEKIYEIEEDSWKADYRLIPKAEEKALIEKAEAASKLIKFKILPNTIPFPPLLKDLIIQDMIAKGQPIDEEPRMKLVVVENEEALYRLAKDGEKPNIDIGNSKGVPITPQLYEIPQLFKEKLNL